MRYWIPNDGRIAISTKIGEEIKADIYYYIMIILSCTIATYGLLQSNTAVIIGAMLVSPLMNPIIGGSLAISQANNNLLKKSFQAELTGVLIAVAFSALLSMLIPEKVVTAEMLSRTKPTLLDLIIALASGAAGTYAICYKPNSAILPGVAISTALMPPLCVIGIGVAYKQFDIATGALLLFLANIIAINFVSIVIFKIFGFNNIDSSENNNKSIWKRFFSGHMVYSAALLCIVAVPLLYFMYISVAQNNKDNIVRSTITEEMRTIAKDSVIVSVSSVYNNDTFKVDATIRSTNALSMENIRQIENILEYRLLKPVKFNAEIIIMQKINNSVINNGYDELLKAYNKPVPVEILKVMSPEEIIEGSIDEKFSLLKNSKVENFKIRYEKNLGIYYIDVDIKYAGSVDNNFNKSITAILEDKLKRKVMLTITNIEIMPTAVPSPTITPATPINNR